jgi:hypothetical protein
MLSRSVIAFGLAMSLALGSAAHAAKPGKKKGQSTIRGVVTEVKKDKDTGTITVKPVSKKTAATSPAPAEDAVKQVAITKETKFEKVSGKKDARETQPAAFSAVEKDMRVQVILTADKKSAEKVTVVVKKKKTKT